MRIAEIFNPKLNRDVQARREANDQNLISSGQAFEYTPISYRTYDASQKRDDSGHFTKGFDLRNENIADAYVDNRNTKTLPVQSSAISKARYDPKDDSLNITYTSGSKEYKFKAGGKEGLKEWLSSPSKGRITQLWRETHRFPGM